MQYVWKSFWAHLMELLGYVGQVEGFFGSLGDGVNIGEIGAWFCAECTLGIKIILGVPDGTPR
jgi:hypothetical protein